MKKMILTTLVLLLVSSIFGYSTGKSLMYSDSYLLRAQGADALYWNPALLTPNYAGTQIPLANTAFFATNNSLDLATYNHIMGRSFLTEEDKEKLLSKIDTKIAVSSEFHTYLYGNTFGSYALSSSLHLFAKAAVAEKYLDLALNGNTETEYHFNKSTNNLAALSFVDMSFGRGNMLLPKIHPSLPIIKYGYSGSLLFGLQGLRTKQYTGMFSSSYDGLFANQDLVLQSGVAGLGFKGSFGLFSEPIPNLQAGLALDNILGFINWGAQTEDIKYHISMEEVYIADLQDDFYTESKTTVSSDNWTSKLPMELKLATMYKFPKVNLSLDLKQGFGNSIMTSKIARWSLGGEYLFTPIIPIHYGLALGNSEYPWRVSYGMGLRLKTMEFGLGVQSFESIAPGYKSKGISFASYFNLRR